MRIQSKAKIKKWEADSDFTIVLTAENDDDRGALLDAMRRNVRVKVTVEWDDVDCSGCPECQVLMYCNPARCVPDANSDICRAYDKGGLS